MTVSVLAGCDPLTLSLHPDDELPLVPPSSQRPEGQLRLVEAEDPLPDLESKISVLLAGSCWQAGLTGSILPLETSSPR